MQAHGVTVWSACQQARALKQCGLGLSCPRCNVQSVPRRGPQTRVLHQALPVSAAMRTLAWPISGGYALPKCRRLQM
eukprot:5258534-Amphidinium_carterae.1